MEPKTAFKGCGKLQQHQMTDKTRGYSTTNLEQDINHPMAYFTINFIVS